METNFTRSEFPSRIPAPADILPSEKGQSDGSNSAEGDQYQASPWVSPMTMTLKKTLQGLVKREAQPKHLLSRVLSRALDSRDPGEPLPDWVWPPGQG